MICLPMTVLGSSFSVNKVIKNCTVKGHEHGNRHINTKIYKYYFAENLNDNVHKVVIDAGHGGHDPGCQGKHSNEKDIALEIALQTGKTLNKSRKDIEVIYTRTSDVFIPLHKRIALANEKKADIFISIHCNYVGNPKICGTETYVMGLHRAEENLNVAKRENAAVLLEENFESNYEGYDPNSPIGHILLSMYQNLHLDQSIVLADDIESKLSKRTNIRSRGVKQAGFVVLREATMPSILIETGFLSNPKEEKYLMSKTGQAEISTAISSSLNIYFKSKPIISKNQSPQITKSELSSNAEQQMNRSHSYTVQIGVYSKGDKSLLQNSELANEILITPVGDLYRYTLGSYGDKSTAQNTLTKIHNLGLKAAYIKKVN